MPSVALAGRRPDLGYICTGQTGETTMDMTFAAPRFMQIGGGGVRQVAALLGKLGLSRPLVVTDPFMVSSGLVQTCLEPLAAAGIGVTVFSATIPEPTDTVVEAGVGVVLAGDFDCLIAFGGGSPIDTAKAMAVLAAGGGKMRDYKVPVAADVARLPVIAIPTTAGTGSECTRFTVITDAAVDEKMLIAGLGCLPLAAIVDYELTFSVPPRTTPVSAWTASRMRWKPMSRVAPTRSPTRWHCRRCGSSARTCAPHTTSRETPRRVRR
jgi:alcohol dehydrogenase class IV